MLVNYFKRGLFLFLLFWNSVSSAQEKSSIGFGANAGYKCITSETGFILEYKFKRILDLYSGITFAKFNGLGYTIGVDIFLMQSPWQPCIGLAYNYQEGDEFYVGDDDIDRTDYKVNPNKSLVGIIGVRKIILFDDKSANGFMTFTPYLSYRYASPATKVIYTSGYINEDREEKMNNRVGNGIGVGIKIVYFFDKTNSNKK